MNAGVLLVFIAPLFPVSVIEMESKYKIYVQIPLMYYGYSGRIQKCKYLSTYQTLVQPAENTIIYVPCMELEVERLSRSPSSRLSDLMSRESSEPVE